MIHAGKHVLSALAITCLFGCSAHPPKPAAQDTDATASGATAKPGCQMQQDALSEVASAFGGSDAAQDTAPAALLQELARENDRIEQAQLAFQDLEACRRNEAQRVHARFDRGELSMDDANTAILDIRNRIGDDFSRADSMIAGMTRRTEQATALLDTPAAPPPAKRSGPPHAGSAAVLGTAAIRSEPSDTAARIGGLQPGDKVEILAAHGSWRRIALPDGSAGFVQAASLAAAVQPKEPPPAPTLGGPDRTQLEALLRSGTAARQAFETAVSDSKRQLMAPQQAAAAGPAPH